MVNSHFIPQFILRNFCNDNKIQYYNIKTGQIESRSTKSVFSEKGYYPDQIEKDLCYKIEYQFSKVLNNKILNEKNNITLNSEELWILKKYLIITSLRVHDDDMKHNVWYNALKRDGFIQDEEKFKQDFGGDFYDNISRILECPNMETAVELAVSDHGNMTFFTFVKDIIYSYIIFVRTNKAKEDLIMPDRGWANYCGPISVKKLNAIMDMPLYQLNPYLQMILEMSSPQDYAIFPLSNNLAIIAMSPAVKLFLPSSNYKVKYPENAPTLSQCMGFGNRNLFLPPGNQVIGDMKLYKYEVKQLKKSDVVFLNSLLINNADSFIGYANYENVQSSFENGKLMINSNDKSEGHDE